MSEQHDARLDRELRELLAAREPGPAPLVLHERVDRIADVPVRQDRLPRAARALLPVLGLAAALAITALGAGLTVNRGSTPAVGASPAPAATFDPMLDGPGIGVQTDPAVMWGLDLVPVVVLAAIAIVVPGRRRLVPAALVAVVVGYGLVGSLAPVDVRVDMWGPGLNVVAAMMPPGSSEQVWYEVAPPRQPFSITFGIIQDGSTPVRIEGIQQDAWMSDASYVAMRWAAVWIDKAPNGGSEGPDRPFAPMELPRDGLVLWLVGRAGQCSIGPSYDPAHADGLGYASIPIRLRVTVLGWPRVVDVQLPANLVEPDPGTCSADTSPPSPSASPSAAP